MQIEQRIPTIVEGDVWITFEAYIRMISAGRTHAFELLKSGKIEGRKMGRKTIVSLASVRAYIASLPTISRQAA